MALRLNPLSRARQQAFTLDSVALQITALPPSHCSYGRRMRILVDAVSAILSVNGSHQVLNPGACSHRPRRPRRSCEQGILRVFWGSSWGLRRFWFGEIACRVADCGIGFRGSAQPLPRLLACSGFRKVFVSSGCHVKWVLRFHGVMIR